MEDFNYNVQYVFCLLLTLLAVPEAQAQAHLGKYPIQNFTPADYKAGIQNIDFAQNRDMTLFVANNLGVLSFNGNEWRTHDFKSGKKKRSLAFDESTDRLYVGSQSDFGFFESDWRYVSLIEEIPESARDFDEVWDVFLYNAKVYFCTFQGVYVYDGESIAVIGHENGLERSFQANGKLFTQNRQGKLFEIDGQKLVPAYPQLEAGRIIAAVVPKDEGYLLFYNSGQIEFTTTFGVRPEYPDLSQTLRGTYVNHVLQLSDTRLAISTQTSGLFLYDLQEGVLESISTREGLESNACLRSFQDYLGNLWVGMQNGIALIDINSPMRFLNQEIGIQGSGYEAFETDGGTYFTTSNGIYFLGKEAERSTFLRGTEGPAYGMEEIAGKLYAGHHTGLFLLDNGTAKRLALTNGLWRVKQLQSRPDFAIGGTYSGLYLFGIDENQQLQPVRKIAGFNSSSRFFEEDQLGRIWVGQYYKGLYQLILSEDLSAATTVKNVSENFAAKIDEQIVLSRIANDFYLATNAGLYQLDPVKESVSKAGAFFDETGEQPIYLLEQDRKNNVHIVADNLVGFFKQISPSNYSFVPSSLYQLRYHLNNDLLQVSANTKHGILFSANEGFIHYSPEMEQPLNIERPLIVSRVFSVTENRALYDRALFGTKPARIERLTVSPKVKVLKIDVESFQFNNLNNQQFRYFLKGLDEDFGEWSNATTKEYSNLREGSYEFAVQTRNYLGEIVEAEALHLMVKPPFYRSLFAKCFYVVAGIFALFMISRLQRRRFRQKANKIEEANAGHWPENNRNCSKLNNRRKRSYCNSGKKKCRGNWSMSTSCWPPLQ